MEPDASASPYAVLQAKYQAWVVMLLSIVADAYELGGVLGKGVVIHSPNGSLLPDVAFVPNESAEHVHADAIEAGVGLAVSVLHSGVSKDERKKLREAYATARVNEYWQIDADKAKAHLYQASAQWTYDEIAPDKAGLHYSVVMEELAFPAIWFKEMPSLWAMMEWWGMIERD